MKNKNFDLKSVMIDGESIQIPVAILNEDKEKTILITAGIDGDEYAGIDAANILINSFSKFKSDYRVIIFPLVNIFGNKEGVSYNPKDGKFPKFIYPGKSNGSSSEQLIFYLDKFINQSFLWIDLHSGSSDEMLTPFIWTWETKNKKVNNLTLSFLSSFSEDIIIYQKNPTKKVERLAKRNIAYIMLESGELGKKSEEYTKMHLEWIRKIISGPKEIQRINVYRKVKFYQVNKNGFWQPKMAPGTIEQDTSVGLHEERKLFSREGLILYIKKSMKLKKGEEVFATAFDKDFV